MLDCASYTDMRMLEAKRNGDVLEIRLEKGFQKIIPVNGQSIRVLYSFDEIREDGAEKPCIVKQ